MNILYAYKLILGYYNILSFYKSKNRLVAQGGHLFMPNTDMKRKYLETLFPNEKMWIGVYDSNGGDTALGRNWTFVDGKPVPDNLYNWMNDFPVQGLGCSPKNKNNFIIFCVKFFLF